MQFLNAHRQVPKELISSLWERRCVNQAHQGKVSRLKRPELVLEMNVKDFVTYGLRGKSEFGLNHYYLPQTVEFNKPKTFKIHSGKKKTFLDQEIKRSTGIPPAKYEVMRNMVISGHKSNLNKGKRRLMTDDIATF